MSNAYRVLEVPVDSVFLTGRNVREIPEDDALIELAGSIASIGLLEPIVVRVQDDGRHRLLAGERRLRAHLRLKREKIAAHVYPENGVLDIIVMGAENLHREQLSLAEECAYVNALYEGEHKSPDQICALLSKSRSWVMRRLALPNMPEELRERILEGQLSIAAGEWIARLPNAGDRAYLAQQAIMCGWSVNDVRERVNVYLSCPSIGQVVEPVGAIPGEMVPIGDPVKECAACGRTARLRELTNVWIHSGGCPGSTIEERSCDDDGD